ncbi:hypothetical protein AMAG_10142 [Allomyces macrogynus ATCC 38327]|uniref:Uncharacterized protein n=1 Tax=Allomyces macrogynus (strain ATCC 38327) TaxID=578462 RepID=A0A0L0SQL3_ALLM3|nr:hypothetical protein AMAG_10142 [Allomyces macrogynus ATCC 38327]|eukprot:KNE64801.1 hypothetical protein AMAG_10142 [Allomyces macrogynus ATCC 38327]
MALPASPNPGDAGASDHHRLHAAIEVIESLRDERSRAIQALKLAEQQLSDLADEKAQLEDLHVQTVHRWKRELELKCAELDEAQRAASAVRSRDVGDRAIEEVQEQARADAARWKAEVDRHAGVVVQLRSENEGLRATLATTAREMDMERQQERKQFLEKIRDLEHLLDEAKSANARPAEATRNLQLQLSEAQLKISHLLGENDDLRSAKSDLQTQLESTIRAHSIQALEFKANAESLRVERDNANDKLSRAHDEHQALVRKNHELIQQVAAMQVQVSAAKRAVDERGQNQAAALFNAQAELAHDRAAWDRRRRELEGKVEVLSLELVAAQRQVEEAAATRHWPASTENGARGERVSGVRVLGVDEQLEVQGLRKANEDLGRQIISMQSAMDDLNAKSLSEKEGLLQRISSLKNALEELREEHEDLRRRAADDELTASRSRETEDTLKGELKRLQVKLETATDELVTLREAETWSRPQLEESRRRIAELRRQLEESRQGCARERDAHAKSLTQAKALLEKSESELCQQITTLKTEYTTLRDAYTKLKSNAQAKLASYKSELVRLRQHVEEAERRGEILQAELDKVRLRERHERRADTKQRKELLTLLQREMGGLKESNSAAPETAAV